MISFPQKGQYLAWDTGRGCEGVQHAGDGVPVRSPELVTSGLRSPLDLPSHSSLSLGFLPTSPDVVVTLSQHMLSGEQGL